MIVEYKTTNMTYKLTVARDGQVRIKMPEDFSEERDGEILQKLKDISVKVKADAHGKSLRGKIRGNKGEKFLKSITMYSDGKKEKHTYVL